jgi:hypothetical protein
MKKRHQFVRATQKALLRARQTPSVNIARIRLADLRAPCDKLKFSPDRLSRLLHRLISASSNASLAPFDTTSPALAAPPSPQLATSPRTPLSRLSHDQIYVQSVQS